MPLSSAANQVPDEPSSDNTELTPNIGTTLSANGARPGSDRPPLARGCGTRASTRAAGCVRAVPANSDSNASACAPEDGAGRGSSTPAEGERLGTFGLNKSRYRGVSYDKKKRKWRVQIKVASLGKSGVSVGYYDTEECAARAYDRAAIGLLGIDNNNIVTNFPIDNYTAESVPHLIGKSRDEVKQALKTERAKLQQPRRHFSNKQRTSKYLGVGSSNRKNQWQARILVDGKVTHLGYYETEEDAARVYDRVSLSMHGDQAHTNFDPAEYGTQDVCEYVGLDREQLQRALGVRPMDKNVVSARARCSASKKSGCCLSAMQPADDGSISKCGSAGGMSDNSGGSAYAAATVPHVAGSRRTGGPGQRGAAACEVEGVKLEAGVKREPEDSPCGPEGPLNKRLREAAGSGGSAALSLTSSLAQAVFGQIAGDSLGLPFEGRTLLEAAGVLLEGEGNHEVDAWIAAELLAAGIGNCNTALLTAGRRDRTSSDPLSSSPGTDLRAASLHLPDCLRQPRSWSSAGALFSEFDEGCSLSLGGLAYGTGLLGSSEWDAALQGAVPTLDSSRDSNYSGSQGSSSSSSWPALHALGLLEPHDSTVLDEFLDSMGGFYH